MHLKKIKSLIESLLFVSGEPLKISRIGKICGISKDEIFAGIKELNREYQEGDRGLLIIQSGDSAQLTTNPKNAEYVGQLVSGELNSELSHPALEVLSIVAYRGPITRSQIEIIRGVNCSYILRSLLIKGLVERKEVSDIRGYLYEISFDFLKSLGISRTTDLPEWESLSKNEKIEELIKLNEKQEENIEI